MVMGPGIDIQDWLQPLIKAGVIPPATRRLIIDIQHDCIAAVYYECDADKRMFSIDLTKALTGADVISVADMPEKS